MLIAIDFDDTLTRDARLWRLFVDAARAGGHKVVCVTARRNTQDNKDTVLEWMRAHDVMLPVYFTALESKVEYMRKHGHAVDVWIDDDPKRCAMGF